MKWSVTISLDQFKGGILTFDISSPSVQMIETILDTGAGVSVSVPLLSTVIEYPVSFGDVLYIFLKILSW